MKKFNYINLIKNIFSHDYKYASLILNLSILICFLIIFYYHFSSGFVMSSDSKRFSRWADELIRLNFNFFDFFSIDKASHRPSLFFFSVPVVVIALCKILFVNEWQFVFLIFNLLLLLISIIVYTKILLLVGVREILISLSLPLIVLSVDILVWPRYILSDMIYSFLVLISLYFIIELIINNKLKVFKFLFIILLLLASRPSSIPVIFAIILFLGLFNFEFLKRKKNILFSIFIMIASIPFILSFLYLIIDTNFSAINKVNFITTMVKKGMIIHDRPDTWLDSPNNLFEVLYIYFLRFVNFFNPYASTFSLIHILLNCLQVFLILFSILIWFFDIEIRAVDKIFFYIIMLALSVAAFHSFILIDYDWRYRFPIILPLLILFPISLEILFKRKLIYRQ